MKLAKIILIASLFCIINSNLFSLDTRGKEFWFNFMPNFHDNTYQYTDSIIIFIAAEVPTNCTLEYRDLNGKKYKNTFTITNPKQVYTYRLYWKDFELRGYNYLQSFQSSYGEEISPQYFRLTADQNVSVIGHSKAHLSNDAFLIFPINSLGKEYYIMSYQSDNYGGSISNQTPSQFTITAVEDNTQIEIRPKTPTFRNALQIQTIVLNKGESYLVQARINNAIPNGDLTGSYIKSDKAIAVFAGHQRAMIPLTDANTRPSRDLIVEQMVPINFWGLNAYIVPFNPIKDISTIGTDIYRIIAAFDSTEVYINQELAAILDAGGFIEGPLTDILQVESSGPILVAEYKKTSGDQNTNKGSAEFVSGDPFMILVPPKEQFSRIYRCINAQVYDEDNFGSPVISFRDQYITLVAPDKALQSVKIDGVPVQTSNFLPIFKSGYSTITAKVKDGTHDVTCDEEVGIFIYGYGPANSYGYIGGMSSKNIDFNPPKVTWKSACNEFEFNAIDTNIYDSGIDSIIVNPSLNINLAYDIPKHSDTSHFTFKARVIDKFKDASMNVVIKDSIGYYKRITKEIKGFTLGLKNITDTVKIKDTLSGKFIKCYDYEIFNYGKFPQDFDLKFTNGNSKLTLSKSGKINLLPVQSQKIQICYNPLKNPNAIDSLIIGDTCISKILSIIDITVIADTNSPIIEKTDDACKNLHTVDIYDSLKYDAGIKEVKIIQNINCNLVQDVNSLERYKYSINIINRSKDAIYTISAIDAWGNSKTFTNTIKAIDLNFAAFNSDSTNEIIFKDKVIGEVYEDSLRIINQTENTILIDNVSLLHNVDFTIPKSQFPFILNPLESKVIKILFSPTSYFKNNLFTDSLVFDVNCQFSYIKLKGTSIAFETYGNNKCGQITKIISTYKPSKLALNNISPNPSSGIVNLNIETIGNEDLNLEVYDMMGKKQKTFNFNINEIGIYDIEFDLSDLSSGLYYCILSNDKDSFAKNIILKK